MYKLYNHLKKCILFLRWVYDLTTNYQIRTSKIYDYFPFVSSHRENVICTEKCIEKLEQLQLIRVNLSTDSKHSLLIQNEIEVILNFLLRKNLHTRDLNLEKRKALKFQIMKKCSSTLICLVNYDLLTLVE